MELCHDRFSHPPSSHVWSRLRGRPFVLPPLRLHWTMLRRVALFCLAGLGACSVSPAWAQRLSFEKQFEFGEAAILDVSTIRGRIDVTAGPRGRVLVGGAVTVRAAWDVPSNAIELARKIAAAPPITRDGNVLKLRTPSDPVERRAVTVSYQVQVPPDTRVIAVSESGATSLQGVAGAVTVRTQSASIDLKELGGTTEVKTGSGAVVADRLAGQLTVTTSSSSVTATRLQSDVRVRTSSGSVDAALTGNGNVDVETGSSAIRVRGLKGGLSVVSQSGRVWVEGVPGSGWTASTGSSSIDLDVPSSARLDLEASSRSGAVTVKGLTVDGSITKRKVSGKIAGGGPLVRLSSGSGSIRVAAH